ncbi:MAG TPA: class II aldolase/adducin family protein [Spirochaetota bacterium]|nr:class II aldolase/adducin family protein [Spirochaetota bacterium]HNU90389.1 class II aldolase/adducin family protein [Spirochaetota bacterium]HPV96265.1 class II aldolase/adducin family protein [Spirochaetota bacterium]
MGKYDEYREKVVEYSKMVFSKGYTAGSGGNVSMLIEGENALAITPSGKDYSRFTPAEICIVDLDLQPIEGTMRPSIETGMHAAVYKNRRDVNAIIHAHQTFASVFALINEPIPPIFDEVLFNIGPVVDVIPYALSGSPELVENVVSKLGNRCNCYILQNHGALSLGQTMEKAFANMELFEKAATVYHHALCTRRAVSTLPESVVTPIFQLLQMGQDAEIKRKSEI